MAVSYPLDANHQLVSTPTKTEFYEFSPAAVTMFQKKNTGFTSSLKPADRGYKVTKLAAADYLRFLEKDSCVRCAIPEILRNALDLSKKYNDLGNDTKATRVFLFSGIQRMKAAPAGTSLADLYAQWEADFLAREHIAHVRSELVSWEYFTQRETNKLFEGTDGLRQESQWADYEKSLLNGVLKRLEEIRNQDKHGVPKQDYAAVIPVTEMPDHAKTEHYSFMPAAVQSHLNRTRPYSRLIPEKEQNYKVQLLTVEDIKAKWDKDSNVNGQRADILENASDLSKPYSDLGNTTKKVRVFLESGPMRLKAAPAGASLADLYTQWEADHQARELHGYVRSELVSWESVEQRKANQHWEATPAYLKESKWVENEQAFLGGVRTRLDEIRRFDSELVSKRDEKLKQEAAKLKVEADKAAREAERLKKIEDEKNKKAAEEEKKKQQAEEQKQREAKQKEERDAQLAAGANKVAEQAKKMAAYQAEMAELQAKMAKGEITGAEFGPMVGALSKKYFT